MKIYTPGGRGGFKVFSVTGQDCALDCAHCGKHYLAGMTELRPGELPLLTSELENEGYTGVLISGGADGRGSVPLLPYVEDIAEFKRRSGLHVNVHTALVNDPELPRLLKDGGVDRVSFDMVGEGAVASEVYGIDIDGNAYASSLDSLLEAGLSVSPHITIGLNWGRTGHEKKAIDMIASLPEKRKAMIHSVVMLILIPTPGTKMGGVSPPSVEEIEDVFSHARQELHDIPWVLGCMRPRWDRNYAHAVEMAAIHHGCSGMVGATPETRTELGASVDMVRKRCVF